MAVNEELLDMAIMRSLQGASRANEIADRVKDIMENEVLPDIARQLNDIPLSELTSQQRRLMALRNAIRKGIGFDRVSAPLSEWLEGAALDEAEALLEGMTEVTRPIDLQFLMPSPEVLYQVIFQEPFNNVLMSEWLAKLDDTVQEDLLQAFRVGMIEGKSVPQMAKDLIERNYDAFETGGVNKAINNAKAVARTAANFSLNRAKEATYEANRDIVKAVEYVATLDDRTTFICMDLHGNVYPIGEGERPPQHFQCRSTTVPVLRSWQELGIDKEDLTISQQRDMDGLVPAPKTFDEWLKTKPIDVQNKLLGPVRADLWRTGKIPEISGFMDLEGKKIDLIDLGYNRAGRKI